MKVTIACDGSKQSEKAIHLAGTLPLKKCEIDVVNVIPTVEFNSEQFPEETIRKLNDFNATLKTEAQICLQNAQEILSAYDRPAERVLIEGDPLTTLLELSQKSDLMIFGSRGLNPLKSLFLGSISDGMLRHSACPIIIYKGDESDGKTTFDNNITIGFDESSSSKKAIEFIKNFDLDRIDRINLVSIIELSFYYGMSYTMEVLESLPVRKKNLLSEMEKVLNELKEVSLSPTYVSEVRTDVTDISDELGKVAFENNSSLVVVGSEGKTLFDRIILGSTSNRLAHHSKNPVLIVRC